MQDNINDVCLTCLFFIMINVILTPSGCGDRLPFCMDG